MTNNNQPDKPNVPAQIFWACMLLLSIIMLGFKQFDILHFGEVRYRWVFSPLWGPVAAIALGVLVAIGRTLYKERKNKK